MNNQLQHTTIVTLGTVFAVLFGLYVFSACPVNAETTVTSSINVTADGGESHAAVTTIINGKVVEDWSTTSTESIVYSKTISSTATTTEILASPSQTSNHDQLRALITKLQAIISLYVSLLNY